MTFSGRAARSENWCWVLFSIVASTAASVLGGAFFPYGMVSPLNTVFGLFVLIYWACQKGTTGPNRFGPDPLG